MLVDISENSKLTCGNNFYEEDVAAALDILSKLALTQENAAESAGARLPLVNPKERATSRATNAIIAPYSVMACPFRFRPRFRVRDFVIAIAYLRYND